MLKTDKIQVAIEKAEEEDDNMSFMFLKEKYNSEGDFDKLKSRLVAGGKMQDRSEYTVYMVAAIAAKENRKVGTADVDMAFLNSKLEQGSS